MRRWPRNCNSTNQSLTTLIPNLNWKSNCHETSPTYVHYLELFASEVLLHLQFSTYQPKLGYYVQSFDFLTFWTRLSSKNVYNHLLPNYQHSSTWVCQTWTLIGIRPRSTRRADANLIKLVHGVLRSVIDGVLHTWPKQVPRNAIFRQQNLIYQWKTLIPLLGIKTLTRRRVTGKCQNRELSDSETVRMENDQNCKLSIGK